MWANCPTCVLRAAKRCVRAAQVPVGGCRANDDGDWCACFSAWQVPETKENSPLGVSCSARIGLYSDDSWCKKRLRRQLAAGNGVQLRAESRLVDCTRGDTKVTYWEPTPLTKTRPRVYGTCNGTCVNTRQQACSRKKCQCTFHVHLGQLLDVLRFML